MGPVVGVALHGGTGGGDEKANVNQTLRAEPDATCYGGVTLLAQQRPLELHPVNRSIRS